MLLRFATLIVPSCCRPSTVEVMVRTRQRQPVGVESADSVDDLHADQKSNGRDDATKPCCRGGWDRATLMKNLSGSTSKKRRRKGGPSITPRRKKKSAPSSTNVDAAVSPPERDDESAKHNDNTPNIAPTLEEVEAEEDRNHRYNHWREMVNYRNKTIQSLRDLLAEKDA